MSWLPLPKKSKHNVPIMKLINRRLRIFLIVLSLFVSTKPLLWGLSVAQIGEARQALNTAVQAAQGAENSWIEASVNIAQLKELLASPNVGSEGRSAVEQALSAQEQALTSSEEAIDQIIEQATQLAQSLVLAEKQLKDRSANLQSEADQQIEMAQKLLTQVITLVSEETTSLTDQIKSITQEFDQIETHERFELVATQVTLARKTYDEIRALIQEAEEISTEHDAQLVEFADLTPQVVEEAQKTLSARRNWLGKALVASKEFDVRLADFEAKVSQERQRRAAEASSASESVDAKNKEEFEKARTELLLLADVGGQIAQDIQEIYQEVTAGIKALKEELAQDAFKERSDKALYIQDELVKEIELALIDYQVVEDEIGNAYGDYSEVLGDARSQVEAEVDQKLSWMRKFIPTFAPLKQVVDTYVVQAKKGLEEAQGILEEKPLETDLSLQGAKENVGLLVQVVENITFDAAQLVRDLKSRMEAFESSVEQAASAQDMVLVEKKYKELDSDVDELGTLLSEAVATNSEAEIHFKQLEELVPEDVAAARASFETKRTWVAQVEKTLPGYRETLQAFGKRVGEKLAEFESESEQATEEKPTSQDKADEESVAKSGSNAYERVTIFIKNAKAEFDQLALLQQEVKERFEWFDQQKDHDSDEQRSPDHAEKMRSLSDDLERIVQIKKAIRSLVGQIDELVQASKDDLGDRYEAVMKQRDSYFTVVQGLDIAEKKNREKYEQLREFFGYQTTDVIGATQAAQMIEAAAGEKIAVDNGASKDQLDRANAILTSIISHAQKLGVNFEESLAQLKDALTEAERARDKVETLIRVRQKVDLLEEQLQGLVRTKESFALQATEEFKAIRKEIELERAAKEADAAYSKTDIWFKAFEKTISDYKKELKILVAKVNELDSKVRAAGDAQLSLSLLQKTVDNEVEESEKREEVLLKTFTATESQIDGADSLDGIERLLATLIELVENARDYNESLQELWRYLEQLEQEATASGFLDSAEYKTAHQKYTSWLESALQKASELRQNINVVIKRARVRKSALEKEAALNELKKVDEEAEKEAALLQQKLSETVQSAKAVEVQANSALPGNYVSSVNTILAPLTGAVDPARSLLALYDDKKDQLGSLKSVLALQEHIVATKKKLEAGVDFESIRKELASLRATSVDDKALNTDHHKELATIFDKKSAYVSQAEKERASLMQGLSDAHEYLDKVKRSKEQEQDHLKQLAESRVKQQSQRSGVEQLVLAFSRDVKALSEKVDAVRSSKEVDNGQRELSKLMRRKNVVEQQVESFEKNIHQFEALIKSVRSLIEASVADELSALAAQHHTWIEQSKQAIRDQHDKLSSLEQLLAKKREELSQQTMEQFVEKRFDQKLEMIEKQSAAVQNSKQRDDVMTLLAHVMDNRYGSLPEEKTANAIMRSKMRLERLLGWLLKNRRFRVVKTKLMSYQSILFKVSEEAAAENVSSPQVSSSQSSSASASSQITPQATVTRVVPQQPVVLPAASRASSRRRGSVRSVAAAARRRPVIPTVTAVATPAAVTVKETPAVSESESTPTVSTRVENVVRRVRRRQSRR
jgi:DNA repair exonuclease SbcCD ATPase subunit